MITIEEARAQQKKAQKKCVGILSVSFLILLVVCAMLYFVGKQAFNISLYLSAFVLLYVAYKAKISEFLHPKECEGEVTYFNVREERIKETNTHQVGSKYTTYSVFMADMIIKDKNGKTRHKTFRHIKDYDNVKKGDKAVILRFVDKPVVEFQK